jgi:nucleoside-diphosphate-sugar epimerase
MSTTTNTDVVIGTGPLGLAVMRELLAKGKKVRVVNRSGKADVPANVEVVGADIVDPKIAREACRSAGSIYLCAKPPYTEWADKFPPIMDGAIEAAAATKARLIYADNLYPYGPFTGAVTEDLPDAATGPKGKARAQITAKLMAAHKAGKVRAAIGRASDFYGPGVTESSLGERVFGFALAG